MEEDSQPETQQVFSGEAATIEGTPQPIHYTTTHPPQLDNTMGIVGLVLGILGLITILMAGPFNLCLGIPGMIVSVMAKNKVDAEPGTADRGVVMAGFVINIINIVIGLLMVLFLGAIVALFASAGEF